ncbi:alpha/beta fold hydrolase [Paenarthrobacter sp. Z7-10]|uniref:alpha/beta hydrolase n=1 Tax=Paenarthrobacter sp. Z7-10 TaxID=2787635 RepID=UPI0022A9AF82|nr:alpha/beta hydrolase [Paenarthrobacter sp. Z7-10]MCZ2404163.1 alpha/beta fold hydrolase [Paenarthrobacter sp. Z7-10]
MRVDYRSVTRHRRGILAAAAAVALMLSGCSPSAPGGAGGATVVSSPDAAVVQGTPKALATYYSQKVTWTSCEKTFQCATIKVPVDYSHPKASSIALAVIRLGSTGSKIGSLLVNPGGPGASGYDMVRDGATKIFSKTMRRSYDIVGFDPRGVKRSAPVACISDAARDKERQQSYNLDDNAELAQDEAQNRSDIAQCLKHSGPDLGFIDTESSARDMDILRAAVNDTKLNYMGFSYGTKLGATYAGLFPHKVGKFSLDGALDPSLSIEDISMGQAKGFEQEIHAWAADCLAHPKCPVSGTPEEAVQQIRDLNASYVDNPKQTQQGRLLTAGEFNNALAVAMYSTDLWDPLKSALTDAFAGDSSSMLALADYSADRDPNGTYSSNTAFAFNAVNCLDYPMTTDVAAMRADEKKLESISPTFGKTLSYSGLTCKDWPFKPVDKPHKISAEGAAPILVVGTTRDPATPYSWAVALSNQLSSGVLLTWNGDGHTAYGRSNACITKAVDSYFVDGKVPADGTTC